MAQRPTSGQPSHTRDDRRQTNHRINKMPATTARDNATTTSVPLGTNGRV